MIVSFHPCFYSDKNIICAGREPDINDLVSIKSADAVILPQGCKISLYEMARENCLHVFPNYDAKFKYPGKTGQIKLFQESGAAHPKSLIFRDLKSFYKKYPLLSKRGILDFPFVFKFDWGGEGENVFLIKSQHQLESILQKVSLFEKTGQSGFLLQEYIPSENRTLRVVIIGRRIISYWRILKKRAGFCSNLAKGAVIDFNSDPDLQQMAIASLKKFCKISGINLAGFDFLFSSETATVEPLFLEINYFFGRHGLGGSDRFYKILNDEIKDWINNL